MSKLVINREYISVFYCIYYEFCIICIILSWIESYVTEHALSQN
jgi:hypothetical protein